MQEELSQIWESISRIRDLIKKLQKYKSANFYKTKYDQEILQLNRLYTFFRASIKEPSGTLEEKLNNLDDSIKIIFSNQRHKNRLDEIKKLEKFWPELEIELVNIKSERQFFEIPKEIPMNEQRLDLEEAIRDHTERCYLSSLVMCRRSFEGALAIAYKRKTQNDPIEDELCPKCNKKIRTKYIGIKKLHKWAIKEKIIGEKLVSVGFLLADLGAGGAHPPLTEFSREPEMSKLGIQATITLLKQIYSNLK